MTAGLTRDSLDVSFLVSHSSIGLSMTLVRSLEI